MLDHSVVLTQYHNTHTKMGKVRSCKLITSICYNVDVDLSVAVLSLGKEVKHVWSVLD